MCAKCVQNVCKMCAKCMRNVCKMCAIFGGGPKCVQNVCDFGGGGPTAAGRPSAGRGGGEGVDGMPRARLRHGRAEAEERTLPDPLGPSTAEWSKQGLPGIGLA